MADPLTEIVGLLKPSADFTKLVRAAGPWRVRRAERGRPFYCALLSGAARLELDGRQPVALQAGDFVLIPDAQEFAMTVEGIAPDETVEMLPVRQADGSFRLGPPDLACSATFLVGYCRFGSPDAALLLSLLPRFVRVRGEARLATLVALVSEESQAERPGRDVVVSRLLEVLLIEAFRSTASEMVAPGLLRGLADKRLAAALRKMHEDPSHPWTIADLASEAGLSRSVFFERFRAEVGIAPMEFLLSWRMALAKSLLGRNHRIAEVAEKVGYGSTSAFGTAFRRHVGISPARFVRK